MQMHVACLHAQYRAKAYYYVYVLMYFVLYSIQGEAAPAEAGI